MEQHPVEYVFNKYKAKPCIYRNKLFLYFYEFEDDDFLFNAFDLSQLYIDYLQFGDSIVIDDSNYFKDINKSEIAFIKNDYQIVMRRLQEMMFLPK